MKLNSRRVFNIYAVDSKGNSELLVNISLSAILFDRTFEVFFALQEQIDEVMDIPLGCTMEFRPNRDDQFSKGLVTRVK